ncbi:MAG: (Fe-S)-binding protein [Acidobacteriota bacterium]
MFEGNSQDEAFLNLVKNKEGILAEDYLTSFLWNERFFPFSIKHFYPSILGCENILPIKNLNQYMKNTREFSENYGVQLSTEATLINNREAVLFTIFPSESKKLTHFLHLLLTYSLNRIALSSGGKPYGIGTWNLPLLNKKFSEEEIRKYRSFKKEVDPMNLINYGKSFSVDKKITYLLKSAYLLSYPFSIPNTFTKYLSKNHNHNSRKAKNSFSETDACANCGACTIICPAYLKDRNEIVTAKGKLFLLKQLLNGNFVPKQIAENVFLCLHCKLCENVCQSKLKLSPLWDKLESIVENKFGRPEEKIDEFVKQIESSQEYIRLLDLLSIPENNRKEMHNV